MHPGARNSKEHDSGESGEREAFRKQKEHLKEYFVTCLFPPAFGYFYHYLSLKQKDLFIGVSLTCFFKYTQNCISVSKCIKRPESKNGGCMWQNVICDFICQRISRLFLYFWIILTSKSDLRKKLQNGCEGWKD